MAVTAATSTQITSIVKEVVNELYEWSNVMDKEGKVVRAIGKQELIQWISNDYGYKTGNSRYKRMPVSAIQSIAVIAETHLSHQMFLVFDKNNKRLDFRPMPYLCLLETNFYDVNAYNSAYPMDFELYTTYPFVSMRSDVEEIWYVSKEHHVKRTTREMKLLVRKIERDTGKSFPKREVTLDPREIIVATTVKWINEFLLDVQSIYVEEETPYSSSLGSVVPMVEAFHELSWRVAQKIKSQNKNCAIMTHDVTAIVGTSHPRVSLKTMIYRELTKWGFNPLFYRTDIDYFMELAAQIYEFYAEFNIFEQFSLAW